MRGDIEGGAIDALARGILRAREIDAKMEAEREKLDAKVEAEREKKIATLAKMEAEREKLDAKVEAAKEKNGGSEGEENRHVGKDGGREAEVGCKGGGREGEENRKGEENCKIVGKDGGRGAEVGGDREDTRRVPPGCNAAVEEERQNVLQRARDRERWSEVDALVEARMLQGENEILKDHLQQCERQVGRLQSEVARLQSGAGVRSSTASGARGVPAHSASGAREEEEAGTMPGENGTHLLGKRGRERYRDAAEAGQDGEGTPERDAPAAKRGGHPRAMTARERRDEMLQQQREQRREEDTRRFGLADALCELKEEADNLKDQLEESERLRRSGEERFQREKRKVAAMVMTARQERNRADELEKRLGALQKDFPNRTHSG
eukprot:TRINITY_DN3243_c0_g1_i1.p1 TRINITY_DN3243_c0_g1~~TRINITY_DN3243_c0_g1_i1.p1  ORF type:complete len:381 (-),score=101.64 TRINITY_DN3243_c0_g1_i1:280-1422(-)